MNLNRPVVVTPEIEHRFLCFIVFEPASYRINELDTLLTGPEVVGMYRQLMDHLYRDNTLKNQIILNRIGKIGQMIDLLKSHEGIVISKFFDRVWRRYSYISNIGEPFLDLSNFLAFFPDYGSDRLALLAQRIDDDDDDFEGGGSRSGEGDEEGNDSGVEIESLNDQDLPEPSNEELAS